MLRGVCADEAGMRTTNVIPFPVQHNAAKLSVAERVSEAKPFLVTREPDSDVPANGVLDEFAIWAGRLGRKLVSYSAKWTKQQMPSA
jgi:hypothetical protein